MSNNYYNEQVSEPNNANQNPYYNENLNKVDPESQSRNNQLNSNINDSMRIGFIRKVYGILTAQLTLTALVASIGFMDSVKEYYATTMAPFWICFALTIIIIIPLACFKDIARKVPINYILLFGFTFCESIMISYAIASVPDWKVVMMAALLTIAVTLALTVYACTTETDFTFLGGFLFVVITVLFFFGFFSILFGSNYIVRTIYCCLGVLAYSIYLIIDTQLVMGKFGSMYSVEDYIFAALNIYLDIIQLFLYILSLLSNNRS